VVRTDCRDLQYICVFVHIFFRAISVVRTECIGFRLCLCVILILICESSVLGGDRLQGIYTMCF
jgi:hypothetical protein